MVLGLSLGLLFISFEFYFLLREFSEFLIEDRNNYLIIDNWKRWALPPPKISSQKGFPQQAKAKIECW